MRKIDIVTPVECPTLSPERQLLWDAANYMEKHGHTPSLDQHETDDGCVCIMGALRRAAGGIPGDRPLSLPHVPDAVKILTRHTKTVHVFNHENDQATVVAAMRSAALS